MERRVGEGATARGKGKKRAEKSKKRKLDLKVHSIYISQSKQKFFVPV